MYCNQRNTDPSRTRSRLSVCGAQRATRRRGGWCASILLLDVHAHARGVCRPDGIYFPSEDEGAVGHGSGEVEGVVGAEFHILLTGFLGGRARSDRRGSRRASSPMANAGRGEQLRSPEERRVLGGLWSSSGIDVGPAKLADSQAVRLRRREYSATGVKDQQTTFIEDTVHTQHTSDSNTRSPSYPHDLPFPLPTASRDTRRSFLRTHTRLYSLDQDTRRQGRRVRRQPARECRPRLRR